MDGWIKVHRKLLTSVVFRNEKLLKVFMYCLLKATHSEHEILIGRQTIYLRPGQFIFGRKKAALELELKESTTWDYMTLLKKQGIIDIKSNNKYSVITVVNWGFYQSYEENPDSKTDSKPTTKQQQIDTYKNVKNVKNIKPSSRNKSYDEESIYFQLALRLFKRIKDNSPNHKEPNLQKWANDIRLMIEIDKRTTKQITVIIDWCQRDPFWMTNILSTKKLRLQFDQLEAKRISKKQQTQRTKIVSKNDFDLSD